MINSCDLGKYIVNIKARAENVLAFFCVYSNILVKKGDRKMSKQVIYHGSYCKVESPKIIEGKYTKDFGIGFYCTILQEQAEKWAKKYNTSIINKYEYNENPNLKIKEFTIMTEEWLDFIINCRNGKKHEYDIVIGAMADDQVYNYVADLISGQITREAFWELAKFRHPTHQIAFCTDKALKCIKFLEAEEI